MDQDNSSLSRSWDHGKNWKKMKDRHEKISKATKSGRSLHNIWRPTDIDSGAGKGSKFRPVDQEIYDLNYDLAFGNITKEEHTNLIKQLEKDRMHDSEEPMG